MQKMWPGDKAMLHHGPKAHPFKARGTNVAEQISPHYSMHHLGSIGLRVFGIDASAKELML